MIGQDKKILLIMGGYGVGGVAEQFIETMLNQYSSDNIYRFSIVDISASSLNLDVHGYSATVQKVPVYSLPILSSLSYWWFKQKYLASSIDQIKELVEKHEIQLIWIILNTPQIVQIGSELRNKVTIPFVTQIWDTPEYLSQTYFLDMLTRKHFLTSFDNTLKTAKRGIAISDSMNSIYSKRYGLFFRTMVFCAPKGSGVLPFRKKPLGKKINIIFAGSMYAPQTWNAFLDAVEERNNLINDPQIVVHCIGNASMWAKKRKWVKYEPLKPISEAIKVINEADIAYLPYWMSARKSYAAKTAFPSKLSLYVTAGTPIFYHGPKDSTPVEFMNRYRVGKCCHSTNSHTILDTIDSMLDIDFVAQYDKSRETAYQEVFHPDNCNEIFRESIEISLMS